MSETTQQTPFLLERLYYQDQTRAEAYRQRMQLWTADPQALAQAGQREQAAMAAALKKDPTAAPGQWVECYEADEQMDQAAECLATQDFAVAGRLLLLAIKTYRAAGSSREWDLADALWNLGYLFWRRSKKPSVCILRRASLLLDRQARARCWVRCTLCLTATKLDLGTLEDGSAEAALCFELCKSLNLREELLLLAVLQARWCVSQGMLAAAEESLALAGILAIELGTAAETIVRSAVEQYGRPQGLLTLAAGVIATKRATVAEAHAALLSWDPRRAKPSEIFAVLRTLVHLDDSTRDSIPLRDKQSELCAEIAVRCCRQLMLSEADSWLQTADRLSACGVAQLVAETVETVPAERRTLLTVLFMWQVTQRPDDGRMRDALAQLLVQRALELTCAGRRVRATRCLKTAAQLAQRQLLVEYLQRLGQAPRWCVPSHSLQKQLEAER